MNHSAVGNDKRDGPKIMRIGQSAAKSLVTRERFNDYPVREYAASDWWRKLEGSVSHGTDQDIVYSCGKPQAVLESRLPDGPDPASRGECKGLSSKHLLKARPVKLQWPEEFAGAFSVERTSVVSESKVVEVYVRLDDVEEVENEDRRGISVFEYKLSGRAGRVRITTPVPLYLVEEIWEDAETDNGELVLRPTPETAIFQAPVTNTDLAQALHEIFGLIEREENTCLHATYSRLLELLERSSLETPSIHAEMIVRALVRDAGDTMRRPDFSTGPDEPTYVVLKLPQAILSSPSVANSLAFERIKAQLSSPDIFKKKDKGPLDALFGA